MSLPWFTCLFLLFWAVSDLRKPSSGIFMPCLLLVEGTCLITDANWLLAPDFSFSRDVSTWARHHTLRSDVWLILTKRCDYFWKLAVWNNNWQMACKDFLKEPSWLFVDASWVSVFDSGANHLKLQVSSATAQVYSHDWLWHFDLFWTFQQKIPDICLHFSSHLGPLYIYTSPTLTTRPLPSQPAHLDLQEQCCQVVYAPIQRACLSWTWLSTARCWQIWWQQLPHWQIGFPSGLENKRGNKSLG